MAEANLVNISEVYGQTSTGVIASNASAITLTHNISTGNETWVVKSLTVANNSTNNTDNQFYAWLEPPPGGLYICRYVWVPYKTSFIVFDESVPIYLQFGQFIGVGLHQGTNLHYTFKYERLRE